MWQASLINLSYCTQQKNGLYSLALCDKSLSIILTISRLIHSMAFPSRWHLSANEYPFTSICGTSSTSCEASALTLIESCHIPACQQDRIDWTMNQQRRRANATSSLQDKIIHIFIHFSMSACKASFAWCALLRRRCAVIGKIRVYYAVVVSWWL